MASGLSQKEAAAPGIGGFNVGYVLILPADMAKLDHDHINKLDVVSKKGRLILKPSIITNNIYTTMQLGW